MATIRLKNACKQERWKEALHMRNNYSDTEGVQLKTSTYIYLLQGCIATKALLEGRWVHFLIVEAETELHISLWTTILDMYAKCGDTKDARKVFDSIPQRNVVSWTAMISGYAQYGDVKEALLLFQEMLHCGYSKPNAFTYLSVLNACANSESLKQGMMIHLYMIEAGAKINVFVGNALVNMYAKCGHLNDACQVINTMPSQDVVTWTALISGYANHGLVDEAYQIFQQMEIEGLVPTALTFSSILRACIASGNLSLGKQIHVHISRSGTTSGTLVSNNLIELYSKCGLGEYAHILFVNMYSRDVVSWNSMICGYAKHGIMEVLKHYNEMLIFVKPNHVTYVSILKMCANNGDLYQGKILHMDIIEIGLHADAAVANSLIDMYAKCESLEDAHRIFDMMFNKDVVSWSTLIAGYTKNENADRAINLYWRMCQEGAKQNEVTCLSIATAFSMAGDLEQSMQFHAHSIKHGFDTDTFVFNALIDMYAKCGNLHSACAMFDKVQNQDVVAWNAIIVGYAQQGYGRGSLLLFEEMQLSEVKPNEITFIAVLSACSHAGLLEEGCSLFNFMVGSCNIVPTVDHYACMVDLLARAGCLNNAKALVRELPDTSAIIWRGLLSACKIHGNFWLATYAFEKILKLEPQDCASIKLLSSIYAAAGKWTEQAELIKSRMFG